MSLSRKYEYMYMASRPVAFLIEQEYVKVRWSSPDKIKSIPTIGHPILVV